MKKVLAVIGIVLPFIFWLIWIISSLLIAEMVGEPTSTIIFLSYLKIIWMIWTLIGLITLVIWEVYIWREKWLTHREIFKQTRSLTKKNVGKFLLWVLLLFVLQAIQNWLSKPDQPMTIITAILILLIWVVYLWIDLGLKNISLSLSEDKSIKVSDIFVDATKFLKYLGAYVITWFATVIWTILLIAPGIFVAMRLNMIPYLILEKNLGPWQAITHSWKMTKGFASNIFALNILFGAINLLWLLALLVGLFWTLPLFYIANAILYKKLLSHKK